MSNDAKCKVRTGDLFIRLCEGIKRRGGGGSRLSRGDENGLSLDNFESLNRQSLVDPHTSKVESYLNVAAVNHRSDILDYIYQEITAIKTYGLRSLTRSESLQVNLCTRMHNLFQDDVSDPLELILAMVNEEPYQALPSLPYGKQTLLGDSRWQSLQYQFHELHKVKLAIKILLEVRLGFTLMSRLEDLMHHHESEIRKIKSTYKSGAKHVPNY